MREGQEFLCTHQVSLPCGHFGDMCVGQLPCARSLKNSNFHADSESHYTACSASISPRGSGPNRSAPKDANSPPLAWKPRRTLRAVGFIGFRLSRDYIGTIWGFIPIEPRSHLDKLGKVVLENDNQGASTSCRRCRQYLGGTFRPKAKPIVFREGSPEDARGEVPLSKIDNGISVTILRTLRLSHDSYRILIAGVGVSRIQLLPTSRG